MPINIPLTNNCQNWLSSAKYSIWYKRKSSL